YNYDESGFGIGKVKIMRVIIDIKVKQNYQAEPDRQEWVTIMDCICADGTSISPMIIFKGENCDVTTASHVLAMSHVAEVSHTIAIAIARQMQMQMQCKCKGKGKGK